ncbi:glycosyltransferase [Demequina mangrovi]|uniref:D-inositol 3-phosphate glycosyltransferase n=1 Tax=Demequina mangrovi TaxID=1043493 RepID=A0A1H7APF7_9MICO|nr:glycosyltransferase [Demequina mangrovi]SEJ65717.1 Glycosyltransferase involved in cell wall bisynthesis [Demequina mangrovi]
MALPRVLVLTSTLPAREGDGTPAFVADLSRELGREFEVRVLAPAVPGAATAERLSDTVEVVRYRYFPERWEDLADGAILENVRARRSRLAQVPFLLGGLASALRREIRDFRPDAIHAHWIIPQGIVARRYASSVPTVVTTLGGDLYALDNAPARAQKSRVMRAASAVTVMNADMRERVLALGADPATTHVIPMGARVGSLAHDDRQTAKPATRKHPVHLLAVGRLVEKKGFDVLLEAMRRTHARLDLTIVGDGPERARLEAQAEGLRVTFLGQLGRAELDAALSRSGIAVFPSRRAASGDQDGLPVAMLEAMGAGCAVVASDLPGLNEAIQAGHSGVLVPEGDPDALARSLEVIVEDQELRAALGVAARERAQEYSVEAVGARYRALFHDVIG